MASVESLSIFSRGARPMAAPRRLSTYVTAIAGKLRRLAPYAMIELILPGGSLLALLLWLYRRHRNALAGPGSLNTLLSEL